MATYDPKKARGHHTPTADEPAAVDALLGPAEPAPEGRVQPLADTKLAARVEVKTPVEPDSASVDGRADAPPSASPYRPVTTAAPSGSSASKVAAALAALVAVVVLVLWWRRRRRSSSTD